MGGEEFTSIFHYSKSLFHYSKSEYAYSINYTHLRGEKRNVSICGGPENDRLLWLSKRYGGVGESGLEKRSVYIALHWAYI